MPTLISILTPLFAAFFGAAAAFTLNAVKEIVRDRRQRLGTVNGAIYSLILSVESLLNLKKQFLVEHDAEFREIASYLAEVPSPTRAEGELDAIGKKVFSVMARIAIKDQTLNGAFKEWQEIEFITLPETELIFTIHDAPELLRLLVVANREMTQISKRICLRNSTRAKLLDPHGELQPFTPAGLLFHFQMLDYRSVIRAHVDTALVVLMEAITDAEKFRKAHFKKRRWLARRLFGREQWIAYELPDEWKVLVPKREDYPEIVGARA